MSRRAKFLFGYVKSTSLESYANIAVVPFGIRGSSERKLAWMCELRQAWSWPDCNCCNSHVFFCNRSCSSFADDPTLLVEAIARLRRKSA